MKASHLSFFQKILFTFLTLLPTIIFPYSWFPWWETSPNIELSVNAESPPTPPSFKFSFDSWKKTCDALPSYFPDAVRIQYNYTNILQAEELINTLVSYFHVLNKDKDVFLNKNNWVQQSLPDQLIDSLQTYNKPAIFDPYVEKIVLNSDSIIAFHGDIHGDVHSLLDFLSNLEQRKFLKGFEIIHSNFYLVFLGDYTDRGLYGPEVIYTILRLKIANPHRVFLVRGNHEQEGQNKYDSSNELYYECFWSQLEMLYGSTMASDIFKKIMKMYESLPLALYLGCTNDNQTDYILCCHGGIELGFDPLPLLNHASSHAFIKLGTLKRLQQLWKINRKENLHIFEMFQKSNISIKTFQDLYAILFDSNNLQSEELLFSFIPKELVTAYYPPKSRYPIGLFIGFQWNDYEVDSYNESSYQPTFVRQTSGRGLVIGETINHAFLQIQSDKNNKVHGIFRAHQHMAYDQNPMMKRILNKDKLDFDCNRGVGRLWITKNNPTKYPYQLWDNIVCTFNVSPNTIYQLAGFTEDTFGLLTLAKGYENWHLDVINQITLR